MILNNQALPDKLQDAAYAYARREGLTPPDPKTLKPAPPHLKDHPADFSLKVLQSGKVPPEIVKAAHDTWGKGGKGGSQSPGGKSAGAGPSKGGAAPSKGGAGGAGGAGAKVRARDAAAALAYWDDLYAREAEADAFAEADAYAYAYAEPEADAYAEEVFTASIALRDPGFYEEDEFELYVRDTGFDGEGYMGYY